MKTAKQATKSTTGKLIDRMIKGPTVTVEYDGTRVIFDLSNTDGMIRQTTLHAADSLMRLLAWKVGHGESMKDWSDLNHTSTLGAVRFGTVKVEKAK